MYVSPCVVILLELLIQVYVDLDAELKTVECVGSVPREEPVHPSNSISRFMEMFVIFVKALLLLLASLRINETQRSLPVALGAPLFTRPFTCTCKRDSLQNFSSLFSWQTRPKSSSCSCSHAALQLRPVAPASVHFVYSLLLCACSILVLRVLVCTAVHWLCSLAIVNTTDQNRTEHWRKSNRKRIKGEGLSMQASLLLLSLLFFFLSVNSVTRLSNVSHTQFVHWKWQ